MFLAFGPGRRRDHRETDLKGCLSADLGANFVGELRVLASIDPLYASDPFCTALQVAEPRDRHILEVVAPWDPWPTIPSSREYLAASLDIRTCQA
jgi:hypothetical protein